MQLKKPPSKQSASRKTFSTDDSAAFRCTPRFYSKPIPRLNEIIREIQGENAPLIRARTVWILRSVGPHKAYDSVPLRQFNCSEA